VLAGVVAAEEQFSAGGAQHNPDVGLGSTTVATVHSGQFAGSYCCCHDDLLQVRYAYITTRRPEIYVPRAPLSLYAYLLS
jgi:hypothetical protein